MSKTLYIYGAGGHAKVVAATARLLEYEIKGFCEDSPDRVGQPFFGSFIIPFSDIPIGGDIAVAFGNNIIRYQKIVALKKYYHLPTLIHPSAQVAKEVQFGDGCFVAALSNIDPDCRIGDACIINKLSNVSHDAEIGAGTHVSVRVAIAGNVSIGKCCCIGIGSSIIERISIGDRVIVGAGAVVIRDLPASVTAVGIPAQVIKRVAGRENML